MIDRKHRREQVGRVAILANICRLHMRWIFARRIGAVVAVNAVGGYVDVIEVGG